MTLRKTTHSYLSLTMSPVRRVTLAKPVAIRCPKKYSSARLRLNNPSSTEEALDHANTEDTFKFIELI